MLPLMFLVLAPWTQDASIETIRQSASRAIGSDSTPGVRRFEGIAEKYSLWQAFEMRSDERFGYERSVVGILPETQGFDGKTFWIEGFAGVPHAVIGSDRDVSRIVTYTIDGDWAASNAPVRLKSLPAEPDAITIEVRCADTETPALLRLDPSTRLPICLSHWGPSGSDEWTFSHYRRFGGRMVPTRIEHKGGGENERIVIQSVHLEDNGRASFSLPPIDERLASFDHSISPEVEVKRVRGYLFVKPKLDGIEEGWFFFDTGAEVMVLDPSIAAKHAAATVGGESTAGVVATTDLKIVQGISFGLGPVTLARPTFFLMDLSGIGKALNLPVVGICGYDLLSRAAFDIDPKRDRIAVYEPGKAPLPKGARWTRLLFSGNIPSLWCGFEGGRSGLFHLDTGSGAGVDFTSPTVVKYDLLKDRPVRTAFTGGAGGQAESKLGTVDGFEFAGRRYDKLPAGFQLTQEGVRLAVHRRQHRYGPSRPIPPRLRLSSLPYGRRRAIESEPFPLSLHSWGGGGKPLRSGMEVWRAQLA